MMQQVGANGYMQPTPSASAVNIQIFEPKAYAAPNENQYQNPIYRYPEQSIYTQPISNQYGQFAPIEQPVVNYQPNQQMPAPVLTPNNTQAEQPQAPESNQAAPNVDVVQPTMQDQNGIDVNSLVQGLQSNDNKVQEDAITKIANLSQGEPEMRNAVLSEPVMKGLADIIKKDTSNLEGPTEAQTAAINKAASGAELTPEEAALVDKLAPKTAADKNRVIAIFTLGLLQKNQRDEIDTFNQTQGANNQLPQLKINDLIGYNEIENAARNDNEKEVKLAALQALAYVARPEDADVLTPILQNAANDTEPMIQQAANEVLTNLGSNPVEAKQEEPAIDPSKMSRKERKAYEKAMKQRAKEEAEQQKNNEQKVA